MYIERTNVMIINDKDDMEFYINNFINSSTNQNTKINEVIVSVSYEHPFLPENMNADKIFICSLSIEELPKKLSCSTLLISETNIKEIPSTNNITYGITATHMKSNLVLSDNITVDYINISGSLNITSLPNNLIVRNYLDISKTYLDFGDIKPYTYVGQCILYGKPSGKIKKYYPCNGYIINPVHDSTKDEIIGSSLIKGINDEIC